MKSNITIVIPSHNCTRKFNYVINEIRKNNINHEILIVDDNSDTKSRLIIQNIKNNFKRIKVKKNPKNIGQGGSIKSSIKILENKKDFLCTMDDDGQHAVQDVKKILSKKNLIFYSNKAIYGSRELMYRDTPINSFIGNKISKAMFQLISKKKIIDTQTGLRFYSLFIGKKFLKIKANGFDFHNIMNFFLIKKKIKIVEFKIKTIYFDKNKKTRFKSLKDTLKIINAIKTFYFSIIFSN